MGWGRHRLWRLNVANSAVSTQCLGGRCLAGTKGDLTLGAERTMGLGMKTSESSLGRFPWLRHGD